VTIGSQGLLISVFMERELPIEWNEAFSIGRPEIDEEHRQIILIVRELEILRREQRDVERFVEVLSRMTRYGMAHLDREEDYMARMGYPDLQPHIEGHKKYLYTVAMFNYRFTGPTPPSLDEVSGFLSKWWTSHIMKDDRDYERFRQESGLQLDY